MLRKCIYLHESVLLERCSKAECTVFLFVVITSYLYFSFPSSIYLLGDWLRSVGCLVWFVKLMKEVRSASNPDLTSSVCILSVDTMWFGCCFFFYSFLTGTSILQACPVKLGHSVEEGRRWWWGNTTQTASLVKLHRVFPKGEKRTKI